MKHLRRTYRMQHSSIRKRTHRRNRRNCRNRMKGGASIASSPIPINQLDTLVTEVYSFPPRGDIHWPDNNGCVDNQTLTTLSPGEEYDRIGPTGDKSDFIASLKPDSTPYTFSDRSLPTFGASEINLKIQTNDKTGIIHHDFREEEYKMFYSKANDPKGYLYLRIKIKNPVQAYECIIAPAFNYPGGVKTGARQYKLLKPILELAKNGDIEIYPTNGYYPPFH